MRIIAASLALLLSACQLTPTFTTGYQVPERLSAQTLERSLAVVPFEEARPPRLYTTTGRLFLTYVPLLPYVSSPFERLDESVKKQSDSIAAGGRGITMGAAQGVAPPFEEYNCRSGARHRRGPARRRGESRGLRRRGAGRDGARGRRPAFLDLLQLHGEEPPEVFDALPRRALKAVGVGEGFSPWEALRYETRAAGLLLDTRAAGAAGGSGRAFDWALARAVRERSRFLLLAGGRAPENVGAAIRAVRPDGVDASSRLETAPGRKDHERIRAFVAAVRAAEAQEGDVAPGPAPSAGGGEDGEP